MAFIPEEIIQEVIARTDIVDLVGEYVRLERKSASNLFGLCPFHQEKTPSFSVTPDKQIFYCFGCEKGGNAVKFIQEIEHLSFPEAIRFLAARANIEIPENEDPKVDERRKHQKRLSQCMLEAARYFYRALYSPEGKAAQDYMLKKRGLSPSTLTKFGVGYSGSDWDGLSRYLYSKRFKAEEILQCGLAKRSQKDGKLYDLFRDRVMIPIFDTHGGLVAFGGRILTQDEPKYLNSPETELYKKSQVLFALNFARKSREGLLLLTEGYMDTISLHEAGCDFAVASLGTALTTQQIRMLGQFGRRVVIAYDSDDAGQRAADRALNMMRSLGVEASVLVIPGAKDPDDFIHENGAERFRALIPNAYSYLDFKIYRAHQSSMTVNGSLDTLAYQERVIAELTREEDLVKRELYARKLAEELGVTPQAVLREIERRLKRGADAGAEREQKLRTPRQGSQSMPGKKEISLSEDELIILAALFQDHELAQRSDLNIRAEDFSAEIRNLMRTLLQRMQQSAVSIPEFLALAEQELPEESVAETVSEFLSRLSNEGLRPADELLSEALGRLRGEAKQQQAKELFARYSSETDPLVRQELAKAYRRIISELNQ